MKYPLWCVPTMSAIAMMTKVTVKGWSYENTARNFRIHHNVFDRAAYRIIHAVAGERESCPEMEGNTYVQHLDRPFGKYGANRDGEPADMIWNSTAKEFLQDVVEERNPTVCYLESDADN